MSLRIEVDQVAAVLLADGWHCVEPGSFALDAYEFVDGGEGGMVLLGGGQERLVPATGFMFTETSTNAGYFGPLTSVLAVREERR
jgi:hypothetical protein